MPDHKVPLFVISIIIFFFSEIIFGFWLGIDQHTSCNKIGGALVLNGYGPNGIKTLRCEVSDKIKAVGK